MKKLLKTFKEEIILYPLLIALFYLLNWGLSVAFPNGAFFDFFSVLETLYFGLIKTMVGIATGMVLLRITFPQVFKEMVHYYHVFPHLAARERKIITFVLVVLFLLLPALSSRAQGSEVRNTLIKSLESQLNVREVGYNTGPEVDKYLYSVGATPGQSWCGAFVGYNLTRLGVKNPNSAWSPSYAGQKDIIWSKNRNLSNPLPGDVATYYYPNLKRVGHVGFFVRKDFEGYFITIEGNTNGDGIREGDGVYKKKREPGKVHAITRYIK